MTNRVQLTDASNNPYSDSNPLPTKVDVTVAEPADTFGNAATITAATTFSGVPTISQLAANSSALLANPGSMATFIAEIAVASAFVGTLSFYGLEPDGATLQLVGAHLRGVGTTTNTTAINTGSAVNQTWMGNAATFKTIYVVCTAFTSGSASVQLGLSAAPYAMAILNKASVQAASGDFAAGSIVDLATALTTLATQATLLAAKTDLDTIVTNTNKIPASPATEGGNLATLAGIVSASKAAVKAAAGDFADLATLAGAITASVMQSNIKNIGGSTYSNTNPFVTEGNIANWIRNGQGYMVSPGQLATATNANLTVCPLSLFNASGSGKNVLIYSLQIMMQGSETPGSLILRTTTTDPSGTTGFTNVITPFNMKFGGPAAVASASSTANSATASITPTGTVQAVYTAVADTTLELLTNGAVFLLPSGAANGIELTIFVATIGNTYSALAKYIEF